MRLHFRNADPESQEEMTGLRVGKRAEPKSQQAKVSIKVRKLKNPAIQKKRKKVWRRVRIAVLTLLITGAVGGYIANRGAQNSLEHEIAAAKSEGCIVDLEQVEAMNRVPDDQNASRSYVAAATLLDPISPSPDQVTPDYSTIPPGSNLLYGEPLSLKVAQARIDVAAKGEALKAFRAAAQYPRLVFTRDFSVLNEDFHEYDTMSQGENLLTTDAALAILDGRWSDARGDLLATAKMARQLKDGVPLIGSYSQVRAHIKLAHFCKVLLETRWEDPQTAPLVKEVLDTVGAPLDPIKVIQASTFDTVRMESMAMENAGREPASGAVLAFIGPTFFSAVVPLILHEQRMDLMRAKKWGDDYHQLSNELKQADIAQEKAGWLQSFARGMAVTYTDVVTKVATVAAHERTLRQALAAVHYRSTHRAWPGSLVIEGKDALDPHSDKPLRFEVNPNSFHVWSVGPDGIDSHGVNHPDASDGRPVTDDIGIELSTSSGGVQP